MAGVAGRIPRYVGMPRFVYRTATEWHLGDPTGVGSSPASLRDVLALVGSSDSSGLCVARFGLAVTAREHVELTPETVVSPVPVWAGVVIRQHVMIEDRRGSALLLDDTDLRLIDLLDRPVRVADLLERAPLHAELIHGRLERLASAGRVLIGETTANQVRSEQGPCMTNPEGSVQHKALSRRAVMSQRVRTAYRLSSKMRPVREVIGLMSRAPGSSDALSRARPVQAGYSRAHTRDVKKAERSGIGSTETARGDRVRIPVYAPWHADPGPQLSLGMLMASARQHDDGSLNAFFDLHRPEPADAVLDALLRSHGPTILLCSNYVWSTDRNLAIAREAADANPELLVIHGGPDTPKYEADAEHFLRQNSQAAHILVRGEGEQILVLLLEQLAGKADGIRTLDGLKGVPGLTYRDPTTGEVVRTPDGDRVADLNSLPSPYLTGEFDHVDPTDWSRVVAVETNRGCPYGCTFCDWGSATLSRVRQFDLNRVKAELEWIADRKIACPTLYLTDANFGIMSRDVETAHIIGELNKSRGWPAEVIINVAKNTTKHLVKIMDVLSDAGVRVFMSLSLQTTDDQTLKSIHRSNISIDHYRQLAAALRRRGHPVIGELMIGLPGQTVDSYLNDLQFMLDFEVQQRTWETRMLPNSPMNEPAYRETHGLEIREGLVSQSSSFTQEDLDRMKHLGRVDTICERLGILRHVVRFMQWQKGIQARSIYEKLLDVATHSPTEYPLWATLYHNFDQFPTPPVGWESFYQEIRRFVSREFSAPVDGEFECVFQVQQFLMPQPGRKFPETLSVRHNYQAYYSDARRYLFTGDHVPRTVRKLSCYGPAEISIEGDPLGICEFGLEFHRYQDGVDEFNIGFDSSNELLSPLMRIQFPLRAAGITVPVIDDDLDGSRVDADGLKLSKDQLVSAIDDLTVTGVAIGRRRTADMEPVDCFEGGSGIEGPYLAASVPLYLPTLIRDYRTGVAGAFLHLGHWDDENVHLTLLEARTAANERILGLVELRDECDVLDVACGVGGTIDSIDSRISHSTLVGCDVDEAVLQLAAARTVGPHNRISWVQTDAVSLPFADESFDLVVSIEAMMHFPSRVEFMREAHRVLRPGGSLVGSDLMLSDDAHERVGMSRETLIQTLRSGFDPWPDFSWSPERAVTMGTAVGLESVIWVDATNATARGYEADLGVNLPAASVFSESEAARLFTRLHSEGVLRVHYFRFDRSSVSEGG